MSHEKAQNAQRVSGTDDRVFELCDVIREESFGLHRFLRHGHLEKVYERGLVNRLKKAGFNVTEQYPLIVRDEDGTVLGDFYADLFVEDILLVELKACRTLADEHLAQILGYMRACHVRHGLLINFGAPKLQIKKLVL